jgi:hypothetical protein
MPPTVVEQDEYYNVTTAWPTSLTLVGAPAGTSRGDRLFLAVIAHVVDSTLDNWNLGSAWTLIDSQLGPLLNSTRVSMHLYTARHQDGAPLPATISPRTSGGTLIGTGGWYRAHLYSVTPSYPIVAYDIAHGDSTADQPNDGRDGLSINTDEYAIQITAIANPNSRTLGAITNPAALNYTERATMSAVTGRGGPMSIIDATYSGLGATGDLYGRHAVGGSGGSIRVRSALVILDADPDPPLPALSTGIFVDGAVHL